MFLKIFGWAFFGNAFLETQAYCIHWFHKVEKDIFCAFCNSKFHGRLKADLQANNCPKILYLPEDRPSTGRETSSCKSTKVSSEALCKALPAGGALLCWEDYYIVYIDFTCRLVVSSAMLLHNLSVTAYQWYTLTFELLHMRPLMNLRDSCSRHEEDTRCCNTTLLAKKDRYSRDIYEVDLQFDHVIST